VTPAQVKAAAASGLLERERPTLLSRLEIGGALTPARRALLEAMTDEALAAWGGDAHKVLDGPTRSRGSSRRRYRPPSSTTRTSSMS
jgi:hypothetical protein